MHVNYLSSEYAVCRTGHLCHSVSAVDLPLQTLAMSGSCTFVTHI